MSSCTGVTLLKMYSFYWPFPCRCHNISQATTCETKEQHEVHFSVPPERQQNAVVSPAALDASCCVFFCQAQQLAVVPRSTTVAKNAMPMPCPLLLQTKYAQAVFI